MNLAIKLDYRYLTNEVDESNRSNFRCPQLALGYKKDTLAFIVLHNLVNIHCVLYSRIITKTINDIARRAVFDHNIDQYIITNVGEIDEAEGLQYGADSLYQQ